MSSIIFSENSYCFILLKIDFHPRREKFKFFLDYEVFAYFIDKNLIKCYNISIVTKKYLVKVTIIDVNLLISTYICHLQN